MDFRLTGLVAAAFTPLRAVGVGASTGLAPSTLTNATADFPAPSAATGALGLIGLELNPNTAQGQTFTILDNTPTDLFTDAADGDMTLVASPGDQSIGVYTFDNLSVTGAAEVETADQCVVIGTLDTSGGSLSCAPFPIVPVP